jgi:hypothetical protein
MGKDAFGTTDFEPGYLGIGYDTSENNDGFGFFLDDYIDGQPAIDGESCLCEKCECVDCQCGYKFDSDKIIEHKPAPEPKFEHKKTSKEPEYNDVSGIFQYTDNESNYGNETILEDVFRFE